MIKIGLQGALELARALEYVVGFETDNSCGDPDCCGGPFYDREQFDDAVAILKKYGIKYLDR